MPPRKQTTEEQQEELRNTLETFTAGLHDTLTHAVETALATVLQRQQIAPVQAAHRRQGNMGQQPREEDTSDDELAENLFANPQNLRNQDHVAAPADHQLNRREIQAEDRR
uniref:Uncharacterized protein n=1 Tax=Brassica oleracea var. oleracea TaxID=109376 RepID=A0A0D3DAJ8_BRAOL